MKQLALLIGVLATACASPAWAQTNNAQYLGDSIPTTMVPGFTYNVLVTMNNTGTTTWTRAASYFLGSPGDSDPFAPARIYLEESDSIGPGQDKTFSFTMTAPSSGGYTTDWRMLREGVQWFGDTLTKQVSVTFGPSPPGAPTITWPTHGMILGSNRPDIIFQGDPSDGYEVHIGTHNTPESTDGWDSGFVSANPGPDPVMAASGVLNVQTNYFVFVRLHNTNGWGPWAGYGNNFYTAGQLPDDPYFIAGQYGSQWQHTICYNPDRNEYLVCYFDNSKGKDSVISYCRLDGTGTKIGSEGFVVDDLVGVGGPHVCYNSVRHEYLIAYGGYTDVGGLHDELRLQRVDAATGALIGSSNRVANMPGAFKMNVAYSRTSNCYLLVWDSGYDSPCPLYATRLDSTAVPVGGIFHVSTSSYVWAGNAKMCYNSTNDEFFVIFQAYYDTQPFTWWDCYGQRVRASDGALLGTNTTISATPEYDCSGGVAYDSDLNRYLVIYDGGDPTPWAQFVSASGTLVGSRFAIGGGYFNGGMSGVAWSPVTKEYLATWASCCTAHNFARRISQTGQLLGEPLRTNGYVQGFGNWDPTPAANTVNGEFLIEWFWQYDNVYVRRYKSLPIPPPDVTPPGPVTGLSVTAGDGLLTLSWTNPSDADFAGTMIRWKLGSYPADENDGTLLADRNNVPGSTDSYTHTSLNGGTTYYYAVFAYDEVPNYATAVTRSAAPSGDRVIATYPFNSGADGWSTAAWKTGSYDPGTMAWSSAAGNPGGAMRSAGSGLNENNSRDDREGGEMWRTIPTTGFDRIRVLHDLRTNSLGTAYYGFGAGDPNIHPDHDDIQEQLTISYRTSTTGAWTELSPWVGRDTLLSYQSYGTRTIDLTGVPGVDSASGFGFKFRWQFNTATDMGDLDNITVRGCRMETISPTVGITSPTSDNKCPANASPFAIGGWASDNVGVVQVTWSNNRGGSGTCSGTSWWDASVPLFSGQNSITIAARDVAGNVATDSIVVTYVPGAPVSILGAKSAVENASVYVAAKLVTAIFSDCLYIEEEDRTQGIKVKPLVMPAGIAIGKMIDFGGQVKPDPSERYLYGPILVVN